MSDVEIKLESSFKALIQSRLDYDKKLEETADLVREIYKVPKAYKKDITKIKEYMKKYLYDWQKEILDMTDMMIGLLNKPDKKQYYKKRREILSLLGTLFHDVGRCAFGDKKYGGNEISSTVVGMFFV
jgi:hypothetical protein